MRSLDVFQLQLAHEHVGVRPRGCAVVLAERECGSARVGQGGASAGSPGAQAPVCRRLGGRSGEGRWPRRSCGDRPAAELGTGCGVSPRGSTEPNQDTLEPKPFSDILNGFNEVDTV